MVIHDIYNHPSNNKGEYDKTVGQDPFLSMGYEKLVEIQSAKICAEGRKDSCPGAPVRALLALVGEGRVR